MDLGDAVAGIELVALVLGGGGVLLLAATWAERWLSGPAAVVERVPDDELEVVAAQVPR